MKGGCQVCNDNGITGLETQLSGSSVDAAVQHGDFGFAAVGNRDKSGAVQSRRTPHTAAFHSRLTDLALKMLAGDEQAECDFVETALRRLVGLLRVKGAGDDAEDYALDTIADCLVRLPNLVQSTGSQDPVLAYMARTALNRLHRAHRERTREQRALAMVARELDQPPVASDEEVRLAPRAATIAAATAILESLRESDRTLVELRVHTNLTWADIGPEVGMSAATARQRWHRIREKVLAEIPAPKEL